MGQEDIVQNQVLEEVEDQVDEEDQTPNSSNPPINPPDRPKRHRSQPKILDDFIVNLPPSLDTTHSAPTQTSSTVHSMSNFVSYEHFSNSHRAFLAAINSTNEPKFFHQAVKDERWKEPMRKEIQALEENGTWTLEELPDGKRAIDSKWVYKIKYKATGEI